MRDAILSKLRLQHSVFSREYNEIFMNAFFREKSQENSFYVSVWIIFNRSFDFSLAHFWYSAKKCFSFVQKNPPEVFFKKTCSWELLDIYRKTPVLESLFNKVAGIKVYNFIKEKLQHRCFPMNIGNFLRMPILK